MSQANVECVKFVIYVQDMDRAVVFYRGVFGLGLKYFSEHWSELTFGDAIVALHGGGAGQRTETGLSFQVADAVSACAAVEQGGGAIAAPPESRPGEPILLARAVDPEGNGFMISQFVG